MYTQDGKPRRKPLVYGRAKRTIPAYNPFEVEDPAAVRLKSRSSLVPEQPQLEQGQLQGRVVKSTEPPMIDKRRNIQERRLAEQKLTPSHPHRQTQTTLKDGRGQDTATFDFHLSDDEDDTTLSEKSMQKRRKLTPVRDNGRDSNHRRRESRWSAPHGDGNDDSAHVPPTTSQTLVKTRPKPTSRLPERRQRHLRTPSPEKRNLEVESSLYSTPKQTRLLSDLLGSAAPTDSPSILPLTSLSLTSTEGPLQEPLKAEQSLPRQAGRAHGRVVQQRKRLIDAMISPRQRWSTSTLSEPGSEDSDLDFIEPLSRPESLRQQQRGMSDVRMQDGSGAKIANSTVTSSSLSALNAAPKLKSTYSRERSHLADMVSESSLGPLSQPASGENGLLMSQNGSGFGSFGSNMSLEAPEEDVDQDIAGIRSIHELRHAGVSARSQVDIESLLEDVEAKGASARARRIRGLTQLTEKLRYPDIGSQILEQAVDQRVLGCPLLDGDIIGQALLAMLLCRLMTSVQLPETSLRRVCKSLLCFEATLLQETKDLISLVRDRKQNLTKTTNRDVAALIKSYSLSEEWPGRRPKSLTPQLVFIRSLDVVFRQARQLGNFDMVLSASTFEQLVQLLLRIKYISASTENDSDMTLIMELTISIIESLTISRNWATGGCLEVAKQLSGLGSLLDRMTLGPEDSARTHHLILRLILNVTNNDSELCDAFTEPLLLSAIFGIVQRDFLKTEVLGKEVMKEAELEGVILALGALSNLAEHSHLCRRRMLETSMDGRGMVDWVAFAFRDEVEAATEASSVDQTTFLVAFGYLSVLLCNLCLENQIRSRVRALLPGRTLEPLLTFVREFLNHFRKAEELGSKTDGDTQHEGSGFVDRFGSVLEVLRGAEVTNPTGSDV